MGSWVPGTDFQQDQRSGIDDFSFEQGADGKRKISFLIHGGSSGQQYRAAALGAELLESLSDQVGGVTGKETAQPFLMGFPGRGTEEPADMLQGFPHGRIMVPGQIPGRHTGIKHQVFPPPLVEQGELFQQGHRFSQCLGGQDIITVLEQSQKLRDGFLFLIV